MQLGVGVGEEGGVNGGVGDGVVYEKRHSTSATPTLSALIDEGVARYRRKAVVFTKLCFLKSGDADAVVEDKAAEFVDFIPNAVAIPLEEDGKRRRRRRRTRILLDPGDEEE